MECQVDVTVVGTPDVEKTAWGEAGRQVVIVTGDISGKNTAVLPHLSITMVERPLARPFTGRRDRSG